jgi:pilus assembly protein Flp/PilA
MIQRLKQFLRDESGPTAVEYAVMLAMIAAAVVGSVNTMSNATADSFNDSAAQIASAFGS